MISSFMKNRGTESNNILYMILNQFHSKTFSLANTDAKTKTLIKPVTEPSSIVTFIF